MGGSLLIQALGSMGLFASRAFVPAFVAAVVMRWGPGWGLDDVGMLKALGITGAPSWFTSDACVTILGLLAALEIAATKNADARALLNEVDQYAKPAMAALTMFGVWSASDAEFAEGVIGVLPGEGVVLASVLVGVSFGSIWGGFVAGVTAVGTFFVATTRSFLVGLVIDADQDDDLGVQRLVSWAEDLWAAFGLFLLILFPLVMLALIGLAAGLVALLRWWAHRKEEASRVPCVNCGKLMYRCAMGCGHCRMVNENVCDVGWLGQSDVDDPADLETQPHQLAAARRCAWCAEKLDERRPRQYCPVCGVDSFGDPEFVRGYVNRVAQRLPLVLIVCGLLGAVWVVGVIPAVIFYRLTLVAPLRRYVPWGRNLLMKWGLRLVFFVLLATQIVPFAGIVTVPLMALVSFLAYRQLFLGLTDDEPVRKPTEVSADRPAAERGALPGAV
ncbi:MAG: hypothetical protein AAFX76_13845 [Planctomycetota bacterium]